MSVFKKLKDVLFDVEEDDIPVITKKKKEEIREENPIKEIKMPKEEFPEIKRKVEPIKLEEEPKENRFNFPIDFDEEIPSRTKNRDYYDDEFNSRLNRDSKSVVETPKKDRYDYDYSRINSVTQPKKTSKPFKISPIISPVYGILDQNYTKDDVIVKSQNKKEEINIDDVRKKAYGKKKEEKVIEDEFAEPLKTLDEILIDDEKKEEIYEDKVLDKSLPIEVYDDELPDEPYLDEKVEVKEESKEDTIESDLFNLIDSMYEERNERVEEE